MPTELRIRHEKGTRNLYYDLNGNLIQKTDGSITTTYTYDYENRLKTVIASPSGEAIYFTYDAFGRRISKEVNGVIQSKYIYDGDNIILDLDSQNNIIAKYIYGPSIDEPLVMIKGSSVYYYSKDGLGSVVTLTDNTGTIAESYTYDEYGNLTSAPSQIGNRYLYTGREYDPEINLYYYRARYYDPTIGRFLQTDPIGYYGGINLYTYVKNNPVNWVDPSGKIWKKIKEWLKYLWDTLTHAVSPIPPKTVEAVKGLYDIANKLGEINQKASDLGVDYPYPNAPKQPLY